MYQRGQEVLGEEFELKLHQVGGRAGEGALEVIPEVNPVLEDLEDSFDLDVRMLNHEMQKKLNANSLIGSKSGIKTGRANLDISRLSSNGSFALSTQEAEGSKKGDGGKGGANLDKNGMNRSTYINLSKISETDIKALGGDKSKNCCVINPLSKWKNVWDNLIASLIVRKFQTNKN